MHLSRTLLTFSGFPWTAFRLAEFMQWDNSRSGKTVKSLIGFQQQEDNKVDFKS